MAHPRDVMDILYDLISLLTLYIAYMRVNNIIYINLSLN